jgi:hypothetical protein
MVHHWIIDAVLDGASRHRSGRGFLPLQLIRAAAAFARLADEAVEVPADSERRTSVKSRDRRSLARYRRQRRPTRNASFGARASAWGHARAVSA